MAITNWYGKTPVATLLGKIAIGELVDTPNGGKRPVALDHFKCPDDVIAATLAIAEERGDEVNIDACKRGKPVTLYIRVVDRDLDRILPHAYKLYGASELKCMGDGTNILVRPGDRGSDPVGVKNGLSMGDLRPVACDRLTCPHAQTGTREYGGKTIRTPAPCQARGYFFFVIDGIYRTGVWRIGLSSTAIRQALSQFRIAMQAFGHIDGIPLLFHLTKRRMATPNGFQELYIPWMEVDPVYIDENRPVIEARAKLLAARALSPTLLDDPDDTDYLYDSGATEVPVGDVEEGVIVSDAAEATTELFGPANGAAKKLYVPADKLREKAAAASDAEAPKGMRNKTRELFAEVYPDADFNLALGMVWNEPNGVRTIGQCAAVNKWLVAVKKHNEENQK